VPKQNPSAWDRDVTRDPDGRQYDIMIHRIGVIDGPTHGLFGLLAVGLSWLWHLTRHRCRWHVEVRRRRSAGRFRTRGARPIRWHSRPFASGDDASEEIDRVLDLIASGKWPPNDGSYRRLRLAR